MKPLIKVCGIKHFENAKAISKAAPDFMGFIFYKKSIRCVDNEILVELLNEIPTAIKKVGVFVNEPKESILQKKQKYKFDYIQLHGDENAEFCKQLKDEGMHIVKAFGVDDDFDFDVLNDFLSYCDYFLFDTKTKDYGGSGKKYNWRQLEDYQFDVPFFLSGGISVEDAEAIKEIKHPQLYAVDINSKFEIKPGLKDIKLVEKFIKKIRL